MTRNQYDFNGQCVFELWFKTATGAIQVLIDDQQPVCFVEDSNAQALKKHLAEVKMSVTIKSLPLQTFKGQPTSAIYCDSIRDYFQLKNLAELSQIELLEADIKPVDRFLMERFICGGAVVSGVPYAVTGNFKAFKRAAIKQAEFEPVLTTLSIDIECDETGYLYSIGGYSDNLPNEPKFVLYNGHQVTKPNNLPEYVEWCESERQLLVRFTELVNLIDPDMLIGWNFVKFDVRVLMKVYQRQKLKWLIGRDGSEVKFIDGQKGGEQRYPDKVYIAGRVVLDGIEVMKNATYHFDSFSLDNVASEVLGEHKLITDKGLNKLQQIKDQYIYDPVKLSEYNLQDCRLVSRIFTKEKLIEFLVTRTKLTGLELERVGGSVAAFTNLYLPQVHRKGWIAPNLVAPEDYLHSPGGFVMNSEPGIHHDVLVFDFKSLYPSIIRTFNVDPIALVESLNDESLDYIEGFRGGRFTREKSILSNILDELWQAREQAKQQKNKVWSNAIKIIMNSFYGVLGSAGCRFYDTKLASSITMRGHWVLNESKAWFEQKGLKVIYGDTDSIFVSLEGTDFKPSDGSLFEKELNLWWTDRLKQEFAIESKLEMEFETHFNPFFMPTIRGTELGSKKRYAGMQVHNNSEKQLVIKGLETVRSDWTELAKEVQTELFLKVFNGESCREYLDEILAGLNSGKHDDKLVYKKRIRHKLESYVKTTPPQIRAARLANAKLEKQKYRKGSVIKYYLSTTGPMSTEFGLVKIDYQHYIDKQLKPIAEAILHFYQPDVMNVFDNQLSLI